MKTFLLAIIAMLLGIGVGLANSWREFSADRKTYGFSKPYVGHFQQNQVTAQPTAEQRPKMEVVDSDTLDFGVMGKEELRSHVFQVRNGGDAPLELTFDSMSCQCTSIVLNGNPMEKDQTTTIQPGETRDITLNWQPTKYDLAFHQTATFRTNDPTRPELQLAVKGRVQQIARYDPIAVDFGSVTRDKAETFLVDVFGYRDNDLAVEKVEFLGRERREFFAAQIQPMPAARIKAETGANSGSLVMVQLKPGLPFGKSTQQIRIHTNKPDIGPFDLRVEANVVSDIRVAGASYRADEQLFYLGTLTGDRTSEFDFWFLVKGDYAATIEITPTSTDPAEVVSVTLAEPHRSARLTRIPAKLKITPTDKFINRTGSKQGEFGRLVFKTNHPDVEEMVIPVSFAVEGSK